MNDKVKAQAFNVYATNAEMLKVVVEHWNPKHWNPNRFLWHVIDEDREKLIPYIDDEIKMAKSLGAKANDYIHELEHMRTILGGEA